MKILNDFTSFSARKKMVSVPLQVAKLFESDMSVTANRALVFTTSSTFSPENLAFIFGAATTFHM